MASGLVNLGISTAYERGYGVLKRLGGSPLGREGLLAAKLVVIGVIAVAQVAALIALAVAVFDGVPPGTSWPAVLATTLVGAGTFAALGLLLAGIIRPDATLVLANVLFLVAILLGGVVVPLGALPEPLGTIARVLPFGALAEAFRASLDQGGDWPGSVGLVVAMGCRCGADDGSDLPVGVIIDRAQGHRSHRPPRPRATRAAAGHVIR